MAKEKTVRGLSRHFIIPVGSQVVLLVTKTLDQSAADDSPARFKKPGSVAVVMKSPPHNDLPYLIQFSNGEEVLATFDELTLRRREIDQLLSETDFEMRDHIIYVCKVGSKAFGLSTDDSDDDIRGIYLPPANLHWSLYKLPEQIESIEEGDDEVYWELEKYIRLALKANPNILETMWTDLVIKADPIALQLRDIRDSFLSRHVYKTYSGYVISQFRRMKNQFEKTGKYKTKHAMHLIRLLYSGIGALETGKIIVDVAEHRDELMMIRNGELKFDEVRHRATELDQRFQVAFESTSLPEQPDFDVVDQFLIQARRSRV